MLVYYKCCSCKASTQTLCLNPIALRKAKIAYNFGLSECSRVNFLTTKKQMTKFWSANFKKMLTSSRSLPFANSAIFVSGT